MTFRCGHASSTSVSTRSVRRHNSASASEPRSRSNAGVGGRWPCHTSTSWLPARRSRASPTIRRGTKIRANVGTPRAIMTMRRTGGGAAVVAVLGALAGCGGGDAETVKGPPPTAPTALSLTSRAFSAGQRIPLRYTCDGDDAAPPLAWHGVPGGAHELVLLME